MTYKQFLKFLGVFLLMLGAGWLVGKYSAVIAWAIGTATFPLLGFAVWALLFGSWLYLLFGTNFVNKLMTWARG